MLGQFDFGSVRRGVDFISGGPPYQPFSLGGKHRGYSDSRDIFPQAVRSVRELQPKAFLFENVKGLTRSTFGGYFEYIRLQLMYPEITPKLDETWTQYLARLEKYHTLGRPTGLHYQLVTRVLNAADYGVSQRRERVFFVGFRSDLDIEWSFPDATHSQDALLWQQDRSGAYWDRHKVPKRGRFISDRAKARADKLPEKPSGMPWRTVRDAIHDLPDPEKNPAAASALPNHRFQPGARSYPGHTGSPLDEPAKTLKAGVHGVPGGENMLRRADGSIRYFTVRESARLQTFPDDFVFHGSWTETMRQLGNAVPVALSGYTRPSQGGGEMSRDPYNPLDKLNLGNSVASALLREEPRPLSDTDGIVGAGVYAITSALKPLPFSMNDLVQSELPGISLVQAALEQLAASGVEERGAIFTRREVVEFMLDLAGYTPDRPLFQMSLLEPSFGDGDFLFPVVDRLLASVLKHQGRLEPETIFETLRHCLRAVELHRDTYAGTRARLATHLEENGISPDVANALCEAWLIGGDFLLTRLEHDFDFVVGNPPYVRQERIPDALIQSYRELFSTIFDRADLYVPFIEKSLRLLKRGGTLSFICSDRWMKNRYGSKLRRFVSNGYHLHYYIDMVNTPAFNADVIAYPAITVIRREKGSTTRLAHRPDIDTLSLESLRDKLLDPKNINGAVSQIAGLVQGDEPWILEATDQIALVRRLEADFPLIEDAGCRVGIGVATGADKVFIAPFDALDVEPDRKLPFVTTKDIRSGHVQWKGLGVINPFSDDGGLVDLDAYPRLKAYFEAHEEKIRRRNVAKRRPDGWYRTIDRIYPALTHKPKLLIPDIKGSAHVVYEGGELYPHHNLYYITSDAWDLHALQAVLMSGIALLFVATYSTIMHGGFLRFQAQYLRRIRLPRWQDVPEETRKALIEAARVQDRQACNATVSDLYRLSEEEQAAIAADKQGASNGNKPF